MNLKHPLKLYWETHLPTYQSIRYSRLRIWAIQEVPTLNHMSASSYPVIALYPSIHNRFTLLGFPRFLLRYNNPIISRIYSYGCDLTKQEVLPCSWSLYIVSCVYIYSVLCIGSSTKSPIYIVLHIFTHCRFFRLKYS